MDDKNKPPKKRRIEMIEDDSKKPTPNNNKNNINSNGIDKREMIRRMQNESQNQINKNDNRPLNSKKRSSEVPPTYKKPNNKQLIKGSVKRNNKISIFNKFNFKKILLNKRFLAVFITLFIVICSLLFLILDKNDDNHNPIKTDNNELTTKENKNLEKEINKVLREHNLGTVIQAIPLSENKNLVLATDNNLYSESKKSNFGKRILIVDKVEEIQILQESANQLRIFYFNQEGTFSVKPKGFNSSVFIAYDFLVVKDRKGNDVEIKGSGNVYQFNNKEKVDLLSTTKGVFERAVYKNNQLGIVEKEYKDNENIYPTYLKPHDLVLYLWNPNTQKFKEDEREYKDPNSTKNES